MSLLAHPDVPRMPGEDISREEWRAAWAPVLEQRLEEMHSGAVRGATWEEVRAHVNAMLQQARRSRKP